jgi:hypothetical protein
MTFLLRALGQLDSSIAGVCFVLGVCRVYLCIRVGCSWGYVFLARRMKLGYAVLSTGMQCGCALVALLHVRWLTCAVCHGVFMAAMHFVGVSFGCGVCHCCALVPVVVPWYAVACTTFSKRAVAYSA